MTAVNHRLITVIRFVAKSYTHLQKSFTNKLRLVLHAWGLAQITIHLAQQTKRADDIKEAIPRVGSETITSGKCKVNWLRLARPITSGGLGILHLGKFARAFEIVMVVA